MIGSVPKKSIIKRGTHYVSEDEACLGLCEVNLLGPGGKGRFRYEIITVIRDDEPAEYRKKLGRAKDFKADQINIIGGVIDNNKIYAEETVGSLRTYAHILREKPTFNKAELPELSIWQDVKNKLHRIIS
jgi:hypothetical protein